MYFFKNTDFFLLVYLQSYGNVSFYTVKILLFLLETATSATGCCL